MNVMWLLGREGWQLMERGALGYMTHYRRGHVSIFADGRPGMGVHLSISGQGCREVESLPGFVSWQNWLAGLLLTGWKASRLDLAFDDEKGLLSIEAMREAVESENIVTRLRAYDPREPRQIRGGARTGHGFYLGASMSETRVRVYDKALQMGQAGHWVRVEVQARNDKAQAFARFIASEAGEGNLWMLLESVVRFVDASTATRRERAKAFPWWAAFVGGVKRAQLVGVPVERTVEKVKAWFLRNMSAPAFLLMMADDSGSFWNAVQEKGRELMARPKYRDLYAQLAGGGLGACGAAA